MSVVDKYGNLFDAKRPVGQQPKHYTVWSPKKTLRRAQTAGEAESV
jgi:hypothetical protein